LQHLYVSATPAEYEVGRANGVMVEQIIRPTGLMDPEITVKPVTHQVDDLLGEINKRVERKERVLVTTLTKRMAEHLSEYYHNLGIKVQYLHSDIKTLERIDIIRDLRLGIYDVLVGVNLLREGLDIPEVSLVAILDADKEGFLRSERSLIQTSGRTARNVNGQVIMYADRETNAIRVCIAETMRRRKIQEAYNRKNGITPESIIKSIDFIRGSIYEADYVTVPIREEGSEYVRSDEIAAAIEELTKNMKEAARNLAFERAAQLRDEIKELSRFETELGLWG
jgi:excinuclease ABC subunit B